MKKTALTLLCAVFLFSASNVVNAATNVYYSVGQNVTDHSSGGNVSITSGVASFTVAQTATNLGVGDKLIAGGNTYYLASKISASSWNVITALGTTPSNLSSSAVTSITHAFSSLNAAIGVGVTGNATSTNYMNTSNLVSGNFILNIPCYYDTTADTTNVAIQGYTTGANNYIRIYTATSTTNEVNLNQRHNGTRSPTKYLLRGFATWNPSAVLNVQVDYLRIEGLQIRNSDTQTGGDGRTVTINAPGGTTDIRISDTISYDNGPHQSFQIVQAPLISFNNVISLDSSSGFVVPANGTVAAYCYNCSAIGSTQFGFYTGDYRTFIIKNSYAGGNTIADFFKTTNGIMTVSSSASSDGTFSTAVSALSTNSGSYFTNVTAGSEDLTIGSNSALKWAGANLSSDTNWIDPLGNKDVIGTSRPSGAWSIGAFESTDVPDTTVPVVDTFTIPSTASSLTVSITSFTAHDNTAVTGYMATTTSVAPVSSDSTWLGSAPTSYTFSSSGSKTLYAWVKDAAGNVSLSLNAPVIITLPAENIYIAQSSAGSDTGTNCANAHSAAWFNTSGNWANPKSVTGTIGPGDTVHLCGTISTTLGAQASGSAGLPITIYFETGAKISTAASTLMIISSKDYFIIDGGTNGIIENTNNGSALGNQVVTSGIYAPGTGNLEVKNLTVRNLYVHSSLLDDSLDFGTAGGIYLNGFGNNISIHDNIFHDIGMVINGAGGSGVSGYNVYNNDVYNYDAFIKGVGGTMASPANVNIYNNHIGATANWDTTSNAYHHDGIHIYFGSGGLISGVNVYNNLFDGDWGINNTAHLFFEGDYSHGNANAMSNFTIYNNIFIQYSGNTLNNGFAAGGGPNWSWYNNTFIGSGVTNSSCASISGNGTIFKNNIVSGCTTFLNLSSGIATGGLNNNLYANAISGGNSPWVYAGANKNTFTAWKAGTGQDATSTQVSSAQLSSDGHLNVGSGAIGAGANLTSVGITLLNSDKAGSARPTGSTAWDIGAYNASVSYSVGGTISGLSGTVVLRNNSGDDLTRSSNGSFTFATSLNNSASYAVTVYTQPSGQTCTVGSGSGTVSSSNVTSVTITCVNNDSTAPVRSGGSPSGSQSAGTTQVTLSLTTDEAATCKYGTIASTVYSSIANTFSTTGGTSHSATITGLSNAQSYNYYVRCIDGSSNSNSSDYTISFSIASPTSTGGGGSSSGGGGGGGVVCLNCRVSPTILGTTTATIIKTLAPTPKYSFTRNLSLNTTGKDVKQLQQYLNTHGFTIAKTGAGSLGKENQYFGTLTYKALVKFQKSVGLPATGFFGPLTRGYISKH